MTIPRDPNGNQTTGQRNRSLAAGGALGAISIVTKHELVLAIVGGLVGASVLFSFLLWPKVEYLPTGNRNLVFGIILPPPGYNIDQLMRLGEIIEEELQPYWNLDAEAIEAIEAIGGSGRACGFSHNGYRGCTAVSRKHEADPRDAGPSR